MHCLPRPPLWRWAVQIRHIALSLVTCTLGCTLYSRLITSTSLPLPHLRTPWEVAPSEFVLSCVAHPLFGAATTAPDCVMFATSLRSPAAPLYPWRRILSRSEVALSTHPWIVRATARAPLSYHDSARAIGTRCRALTGPAFT
jgi:hypothetical protein